MSQTTDKDEPMTNGNDEEIDPETAELNLQELLLGQNPKIQIVQGETPYTVSFIIEKEDHTLGNSLRYFVNKNPDVEFCGYTIPHPSETKMHLRIQTWNDGVSTAFDVLTKALKDMIEACDVVTEKFTAARDEFEANKAS